MKELFTMWKHTKMVILVALSAAIYAAVLIPFKGMFVIIPGLTELRPANVFPPAFGLLFGPAGAWGAGIGNLIGDLLGGTFGWGSLIVAVFEIFRGGVFYKVWGLINPKDFTQNTNTWKKVLYFELIAIVASVGEAVMIAWLEDIQGIVPFSALAVIISLNNFIATAVLGPPLLLLLYPRVKRWGLIWTDIIDVDDVSKGFARAIGAVLVAVGSIGGLIYGLAVSVGIYGQELGSFASGTLGSLGIGLGVGLFILITFVGMFMLSGREQFVEE